MIDAKVAAEMLIWLRRIGPEFQNSLIRKTKPEPSEALFLLGKLQGFNDLERFLERIAAKPPAQG